MSAERIVTRRVTENTIAEAFAGSQDERETVGGTDSLGSGHARPFATLLQSGHSHGANCGTGGDKSFSFNVSTTAAFVIAGGGIKMAATLGNAPLLPKSVIG